MHHESTHATMWLYVGKKTMYKLTSGRQFLCGDSESLKTQFYSKISFLYFSRLSPILVESWGWLMQLNCNTVVWIGGSITKCETQVYKWLLSLFFLSSNGIHKVGQLTVWTPGPTHASQCACTRLVHKGQPDGHLLTCTPSNRTHSQSFLLLCACWHPPF